MLRGTPALAQCSRVTARGVKTDDSQPANVSLLARYRSVCDRVSGSSLGPFDQEPVRSSRAACPGPPPGSPSSACSSRSVGSRATRYRGVRWHSPLHRRRCRSPREFPEATPAAWPVRSHASRRAGWVLVRAAQQGAPLAERATCLRHAGSSRARNAAVGREPGRSTRRRTVVLPMPASAVSIARRWRSRSRAPAA